MGWAVSNLGSVTLTLMCRGQAVRAQSSAEADIYNGMMDIERGTHVQELIGWLGEPLPSDFAWTPRQYARC